MHTLAIHSKIAIESKSYKSNLYELVLGNCIEVLPILLYICMNFANTSTIKTTMQMLFSVPSGQPQALEPTSLAMWRWQVSNSLTECNGFNYACCRYSVLMFYWILCLLFSIVHRMRRNNQYIVSRMFISKLVS